VLLKLRLASFFHFLDQVLAMHLFDDDILTRACLRRGLSNLGSSIIIGRARRCQLTTCLWLFSFVIDAFWRPVSQMEDSQWATPCTVQAEIKIRIADQTFCLPSRLFRNFQSFIRKKTLEKFP
jgi:hypothetical protein